MYDLIHRLLHFETAPDPGTGGGAPAAGTEETPAPPVQPPAEASIPDRDSGPPETIPYSRFKEVNNQLSELKPFQELIELGYDSDSLGRLVNLDTSFAQDPLGTLGEIIDQIEVIPDNRKSALKELIAVQSPADSSDGEEAPTTDEPPAWAKPLIADHEQRQAAEVQAADEAQLDQIIAHWKKLDEEANIVTREQDMLAYIQVVASRPGLETLEQLAEAARSERLAAREHDLRGALPMRGQGSPLAVPSGGAPAAQPVKFGSIKEASRAALADIQTGRLGGAE